MLSHFLTLNLVRLVCLLAPLAFSGCGRQTVVLLEPKENDLVVLNGCIISACNYLALVKAKHALEADFWTRILLVRYDNHPAGHAYCVWETEGTIYGYDRNSGGFPIPVYTRDARAIATVLAQELSNILKEPLIVRSAEFVEPAEARLEKFADKNRASAPLHALGTVPLSTRSLSLQSDRGSDRD